MNDFLKISICCSVNEGRIFIYEETAYIIITISICRVRSIPDTRRTMYRVQVALQDIPKLFYLFGS